MLAGIDINQRIEFVSKFDKTEPKTKFVFRPLSGSDMFSIGSQGDSFIIAALNKSIVSIENIPKGLEKEDYINSLQTEHLNELFEKFNDINNISDDDKKN